LFFVSLILSGNVLAQEVVKLIAETNHSTVQFSVPISSGLTRITGKFKDYQINLDYVDKDITKSILTAVIKTASVDTGIPARDEDLRGKDFFQVEKFPEIKFTSKSIVKEGSGYLVIGTLDFLGISREIKLPFAITGTKGDNVIGFSSRYTLKRSDYNFATTFNIPQMITSLAMK